MTTEEFSNEFDTLVSSYRRFKDFDNKEALDSLEFDEYEKYCRFGDCAHIKESDCGVKDAVKKGLISSLRYENYVRLYEEEKSSRKY